MNDWVMYVLVLH